MFKNTIITLLMLLASYSHTASAKTTNFLFNALAAQPIDRIKPVILGDYIIYVTQSNQQNAVWSYHNTSGENLPIFEGEVVTGIPALLAVIDNHAYFRGDIGSGYQIWKTDGTAAGTQSVEPPSSFSDSVAIDDLLLTLTNDGKLLSTDGNEFVVHDIETPNLESSCSFGINDVIAYQEPFTSNNETASVQRSRNGVVTLLSGALPENFYVYPDNSVRIEDNCYLLATDGGLPELLMVPQDGEPQLLSNQFDVSEFRRIFAFKNQLYVVRRLESLRYAISRFNSDMSDFDATFNLGAGFSTGSPKLSTDYILVSATTPTVSPRVNQLTYLDQDLNVVPDLVGINQGTPDVYPTALGDLFAGRTAGNSFTLSDSPDLLSNPTVKIITTAIKYVITSQDSDNIFLLLADRITGQESIHVVAATPNINASTAGIWHDPSVNNQGLVINQGKRADGSSYLFVSVYTLIDEEPHWFAGVSDINPPQASIEIELLQYQGGEFFMPNLTTLSEVWGQLSLTMTGCDALSATLAGVDQTVRVLDLVRIDNKLFSNTCLN